MKAIARLSIVCADANICDELLSVLRPDNERVPRGMSLKMEARKKALKFEMASDFPVAVSTAIAVLKDVLLFQEIWLYCDPKRPERMGCSSIA